MAESHRLRVFRFVPGSLASPVLRLGLVLALSLGAFAGTAGAQDSPGLSPRRTLERLDSLVRAGKADAARALTIGQASRLLPLMMEAEARLAPSVDTAKSRDTVLEEKRRGAWAALKMRSHTVFTRPVMNLSSLTSVQAVHFYLDDDTWKVADFEELTGEKAPLRLRSGTPSGDSAGPMLPVSYFVPVQHGVDRMRLEVSLRGGDSLPALPVGRGQKVLERSRERVLLETRRETLPAPQCRAKAPERVYLASGKYMDLSDPLLKAKAASLKQGSPDAVETTRRIHEFVSQEFKYKLGASLFETSRTALRDLQGDCSEAAVLTAALLRASGIPSRVVLGYATLGKGVFIGHAWTEAWIGCEWVGVDAALREFPTGAERVALLRLSGARDLQTDAANLMMRTLANLDVQILQAELDGKPVALKEQEGNDREVRAFLQKVLKGMGE